MDAKLDDGAHAVCDSDTDAVTLSPACVTDTVAEAPPAVTVTVPLRAAPELADTDTERVAPLAPELGDTVSHDWFDEAVHDAWFVVTSTPVDATPVHTDQEGIDTDTVAGAPPA